MTSIARIDLLVQKDLSVHQVNNAQVRTQTQVEERGAKHNISVYMQVKCVYAEVFTSVDIYA